jgi:integrase
MSEKLILRKELLREVMPRVQNISMISSCKIRAHNDVDALERWLEEYLEKKTTYRSYKKEGERFLMWCMLIRNTNFQKFNRDDLEAYITFLQDPQPRERWCGPKGGRRDSWYPFAKPLSASALKTALAILNSLMSYLVDAGYLEFNAFALIRRKSRFKDKLTMQGIKLQERILSPREWQALRDTLFMQAHGAKRERLIFLVTILFILGLRIDELARSTWAQFRSIDDKWWFFIQGKGDYLGKIPVNSELLHALISYRVSLKKSPLDLESDFSPLISSLTTEKALSTRQISNLIKDLALKTAELFPHEPLVQQKLMRFSPHWLRHLSASAQDRAGIAFSHIKENLRHRNEQTTRHYVHAYDDARHEDMEKLKFS